MRNFNLSFTRPEIKINGIRYPVLRSDAAILQDLLDIDAVFAGRDMTDPETVLEKNKALCSYIDKLLGAGSAEKILASIDGMEGYDLGLTGVGMIVTQISALAQQAYSEAIRVKYEDD